MSPIPRSGSGVASTVGVGGSVSVGVAVSVAVGDGAVSVGGAGVSVGTASVGVAGGVVGDGVDVAVWVCPSVQAESSKAPVSRKIKMRFMLILPFMVDSLAELCHNPNAGASCL